MDTQIILSTNRLLLKSITPTIIHELFNSKSKDDIKKYFGFDDIAFEHYKTMHDSGMETYQLTIFLFLLHDKTTELPIGECGFHTLNKKHKRAEIFYLLRNDEYKQKGFMSEALPLVIEYGFTHLKLHRIEALIADVNTASKKLLLKNSFTKEGTMREDYRIDGKNYDSDCYSLLAHEWTEKNG
jgi:ribosomal-protein-alanine N-acetyltransferase